MTHGRVRVLFLLISLALPQSSLAAATQATTQLATRPATQPDVHQLDFCWPPETEAWTLKGTPDAIDPHCQVEDLIITLYHNTLITLPKSISPYLLVNAPISGKTKKRGRHLLSFAAFNGFRRLADWGILNGAYINAGDQDNATMLRMSIGNSLEYMIGFSLSKGANPNIQFGDYDLGESKLDTALTALTKWRGSLNSFDMVINKGAQLKNQQQLTEVSDRLTNLAYSSENPQQREKALSLIKTLEARLPPHIEWIDQTARKADLIDIDLVQSIDYSLEQAIIDGRLSQKDMDDFTVHGKTFEGFLAFNGFDSTLARRLKKMTPENRRQTALKRDREGNDLLLAAIKSKNVNAVKLALGVTKENVSTVVPRGQGYYSEGDTPMTVADKWEVSDEIVQLLEAAIVSGAIDNGLGDYTYGYRSYKLFSQ